MKKTNALNLPDILNGYYKPTPGSIAFSMSIVAKMIGPDAHHLIDDVVLANRVNDALTKANEATDLGYEWDAHQRLDLMQRTDAREADNQTDRAVTTLYKAIDNYRLLGPGDAEYDLADKLINLVMPKGVGVITNKRFEEQHAAVNNLLTRLDGPGKNAVIELNVEHFVEKLRELNIEYGQKLTSTNNTGITHQQVKNANALALEAFALVVMTVWSTLPSEEDRPLRNKLLAPIHEQNGRFRQHYARKKLAPNVNEKTGEFADTDDTTDTNTTHQANNAANLYPHLPGGIPTDQSDLDTSQPNA